MNPRRPLVAIVTPLIVTAIAVFGPWLVGPARAAAPASVSLRAGVNDPKDPNIAVLQYLPASMKVATGEKITWTVDGPEPHSITFLAPGTTLPQPGTDLSLYVGREPTSPYDGSTLANSGLLGLGGKPATYSMTFSKPGHYQYYCVIHPTMVGALTVSDKTADAQSAITARGDEELKKWLAEGRAAKKKLAKTQPLRQRNTDGTTTWTVEMGASTAHTDVLAFSPTPRKMNAGDQVLFVNNSGAPHTASFGGELVPTNPLSPEVDPPAPGPSPQSLLTGAFYNTGLLPPKTPGGAPKAARSFTLVVTNPGKYDYVCILHLPSGMAGELDAT